MVSMKFSITFEVSDEEAAIELLKRIGAAVNPSPPVTENAEQEAKNDIRSDGLHEVLYHIRGIRRGGRHRTPEAHRRGRQSLSASHRERGARSEKRHQI